MRTGPQGDLQFVRRRAQPTISETASAAARVSPSATRTLRGLARNPSRNEPPVRERGILASQARLDGDDGALDFRQSVLCNQRVYAGLKASKGFSHLIEVTRLGCCLRRQEWPAQFGCAVVKRQREDQSFKRHKQLVQRVTGRVHSRTV